MKKKITWADHPFTSSHKKNRKCSDSNCFRVFLHWGIFWAVIHNYSLTNNHTFVPNSWVIPCIFSEISPRASWSQLPTIAGTVWGIIISILHRIPACVFSLPALHPPVIFCTRCPCSNHLLVFMSQLAVSWADLVSVCRDCRVSRWVKEDPPSKTSRNRGGVWASLLQIGGMGLVELKVDGKRGILARRRGGGLGKRQGW